MFTPTTPLSQKKYRGKLFLCFCFAILSFYPVYRNFYYSNGLLTYERHRAVIEKRSEFYNPWQYRILCPYTIEGLLWVYNNTVDKIYPVEEKIKINIESTSGTNAETDKFLELMRTKGVMKYMLLFVCFRFTEHLFIFYLSWKLWQYFIKSKWLIFFGLNFIALSFGNAVTAADLSFNTYLDIIFYLLAANIIVYKKNAAWLILITALGALNRETAMLIPALYFVSKTDFTNFKFGKFNIKNIVFPEKATWIFTAILYIIFFALFFALRWYYGYRPQQIWKVPSGLPMLKLNLLSPVGVKAYFELIGTFAVLPLIILLKFKSFPHLLKKWFLFLVPVWFAIHFISVVAYQTRLFMVPMCLIFMPMILWLIEKDVQSRLKETTRNKPDDTIYTTAKA